MNKILLFLIIPSISFGAHITHNDYSSNTPIVASDQNTNENAIVGVLNGNLDYTNFVSTLTGTSFSNLAGTNISTNSLAGSTANSSATAGKINQGTISSPDLRANAVFQAQWVKFDGFSCGAGSFTGRQAQASITVVNNEPVLVFWGVTFTMGSSGGGASAGWELWREPTGNPGAGITLYDNSIANSVAGSTIQLPGYYLDSPGNGNYTYYIVGCLPFSDSITNPFVLAIDLR